MSRKHSLGSSGHHHHHGKAAEPAPPVHTFCDEEIAVLKEVFALFEPHSDSIEATEVAMTLRSYSPSITAHTIHSLIIRSKLEKGGKVPFDIFLSIMAKTWSSEMPFYDLAAKIKALKEGISFTKMLAMEFPNSLPEREFVSQTVSLLAKKGFKKKNTIACVGLCRDEICKPLHKLLLDTWGETFEFSALGGLIFVGKTGMGAALHHAPQEKGRERYLFVSMAHIGIDEFGEVGSVFRPGRHKKSFACGALGALKAEYESGRVNVSQQPDDLEYCLLKQRIVQNMVYGSKPTLIELTKIAQKVAQEDLEKLIASCVQKDHADYAVIAGIQVHGPLWIQKKKDMDYIFVAESYTVVNGTKEQLVFDPNQI